MTFFFSNLEKSISIEKIIKKLWNKSILLY